MKAQQTSDRALEAQRKQARDDFFRDQRVSAYGTYLSSAQWAEEAMNDLLYVVMNSASHTQEERESYRSTFETRYREFVDAGWGLEILATDEIKAPAHELNAELEQRYGMLNAQNDLQPTPEQLQSLIARMRGGPEDRMAQLRMQFTTVATNALSS